MRPIVQLLLSCALFAGCVGPAADDAVVPAARPEGATGPEVAVVEGDSAYAIAVGFPCGLDGAACAQGTGLEFAHLSWARLGPTRATLVATWDATTPLAEKGQIRVNLEEKEVEFQGRSGDAFEMDVADLASVTAFDAFAMPAAGGAFVQQKAHFVLTLSYG